MVTLRGKTERVRGFSKKKEKTEWGVRDSEWERLCRCPCCEWSYQNVRWELEILLLPTSWCRHHARVARPISQTHTHHATPILPWHRCWLWSTPAFTLKYLIYPSKSQNLCLWCLCFYWWGICACVNFFFLAFWPCDSVTILLMSLCLSLWIMTLCDYII